MNRRIQSRKLDDLLCFVTVAREGSFTRAAAQLGVTQSALSQTLRALEERLHTRLLTRTTRRVSPTDAGERLLQGITPHLEGIESELKYLVQQRNQPAGTVRITCNEEILKNTLLPKLTPLLCQYPDIHMEFDSSYKLRDIVAERFDAGVRLGEAIDRDMVAIPIGPPLRMAAAAAPDYFAKNPIPKTPQDLLKHNCINLRMQSAGGLYIWEFEKKKRKLNVRVNGQLIFNTSTAVVQAALSGLGIACLPDSYFDNHINEGRLVQVLKDWCPPFAGHHLYYPSRRQHSPAFALVVEALRLKPDASDSKLNPE